MSEAIAWFAFHSADADDVLDSAGFEDTGESDDTFDADYSGAAYPNGWYIIATSDFELLEPSVCADWSEGHRMLAGFEDAEAGSSFVMEWVDGKLVWSVAFDRDEGAGQVSVGGKLPLAFEKAVTESASSPFEIPAAVAFQVTGFRAALIGFDPDGPVFHRLEPL
jgi:hypothetical protein